MNRKINYSSTTQRKRKPKTHTCTCKATKNIKGENMEITLNAKKKKKLSKKEMMLENLRWKLKFHEEQAKECKKEIDDLMNEWSDD